WYLYKIRHLVENAFARLKHFRALATRYDKLKRNYESSVSLAPRTAPNFFMGLSSIMF
ncbi:transposase, partial [Kingella kingae]|nr:transposase [Kingella kingae]MBD3633205.1 transposase [Kingella kingae]MBD3660507.1 transposase [Kingella kingae]